MELFITTFEAVASLLCIGVVGFYVISRKILPENAISMLTVLTIDVALPAMVLASILTKFDPEKMTQWWKMPLWLFAFAAFAFVLSWLLSRVLSPKYKPEFHASLFYQNAVFFPIAIITGGSFGGTALIVDLFLFTLLFASMYFMTVAFFFKNSGSSAEKIKIFNPVLIATIAGLVLVLTGIDRFIPRFVASSLAVVGDMSTPILMLVLGGCMYFDFRDKGSFEIFETVKFIIAKNIVFPAVMLLIIAIWRPAYNLAFLMMIQAAVPPITSLSVMAIKFNANTRVINQFILSSFIASLLTIPFFLSVFHKFYP